MPEWQHRFTATKPYNDPHGTYVGCTLAVIAGLQHLSGNDLPYFSVTAEIRHPKRGMAAGGCLHRDVLAHWPELAPVVRLHLADATGRPMHMEANGWYHLAGYYGGAGERFHAGNGKRQHWKANGKFDGYREPTPEECLQTFADHVRISIEDAKELAIAWRNDDDWGATRRWFGQWLTTQTTRMQAEAQAACELLDRLIAGGVEAL